MRAFEAVGRNMSFTAGAHELTVSQSAVSRHVSTLEELLGKALFERGPAGLRLTPAGEALLPAVSKSLDRMEQTVNSIRSGSQVRRTLRVHFPPSLLYQTALPLLHDFHTAHPEIRIDVSTSLAAGPPPGRVDMAIVFDRPNADDMVTDLLRMIRVAPLCAPAAAASSEGRSLEEFLRSNELLHIKIEGEPPGLLWSLYADQQRLSLDTSDGLSFETAFSAAHYAMKGTGVVLTDIDLFAAEIARGDLVMPYNAISADGFGYYLKTHPEDLSDPAIFLFRDWIIRHFPQGDAA